MKQNFYIILIALLSGIAGVYAQTPAKALLTESFLDFENCNSPIINLLNGNENVISSIGVARWESAFPPIASSMPLRANFSNFDEERFYIEVQSSNNLGSSILVNMESLDKNGVIIDHQIDILLTRLGAFSRTYRSTSRILVSDNDEFDDDFSYASVIDSFDGDDDQGTNEEGENDPTIYAILDGEIRVSFSIENETYDRNFEVCTASIPKKVKLNLISMKTNNNNGTYFAPDEILREIDQMNKSWAQCCFHFVNRDGETITDNDIISLSQPENLSLDEGLQIFVSNPDPSFFNLTDQQMVLLDAVKDDDETTLDVVFLGSLNEIEVEGQPPVTIGGVRGTALLDWHVINAQIEEKYSRTIFLTTSSTYFTGAHEIGHVLTNLFHYGEDYFYENYELHPNRNLMRAYQQLNGGDPIPGTSLQNGVGKSKRLVEHQCINARDNTALPY